MMGIDQKEGIPTWDSPWISYRASDKDIGLKLSLLDHGAPRIYSSPFLKMISN